MNTEEKAKAYDEAVNKLRRFMEQGIDPLITRADVQDFFPGLVVESEDERIRKSIIKFLIDVNNGAYTKSELEIASWITWLEKQSNKNTQVTLPTFTFEDVLALECSMKTAKITKGGDKLYEMLVRLYDKIHNAYLIEKQGEEKTANYPIEGMYPYTDPADTLDGEIENIWNKLRNCDNTFTAAKSGFYEVIHHFANWLEKQGEMSKMCPTSVQDEQQPIDKVEPKFKVGDWIIHQGTENIYQVVSRIDNQYQLKYGDNYTIQKCADVDKDARLWTIDDAKDGDVLADDDNNIFIFDGTVEEGKYPFAYCGLTAQGFDSYDIRLPFTHDNNIHPATWEQRNLLFKKMKESGYEWDDEKKELKKIEKKPQRMVSAEAKEALYDKPTDEEMKELLRTEYEKGRADTIAEMEKDWSEEDEARLMKVIWYVNNPMLSVIKDTMLVEWLKQLKQRYTWKPSEEQMDALNDVISSRDIKYDVLSELWKDLKKLK